MTQIQSQWLDISAGLRAWYARPKENGPFPAVLVFIEAFGVNEHFQDVAERLAREGYCAVVPDSYHGRVYDYTDFSSAIGHLKTLRDAQVMAEARATLEHVRSRPEVRPGRVGVVGFCMGGRYAFMANAELADSVSVAVAFYGGGIAPEKDPAGRQPLLHLAESMQAPITLLYGAEDTSILPDEHGRIATALSRAKKRYNLSVFPDAPHGFFSDRRDSYRAGPAQAAWQITLQQFREYLGDQA